MCGICGVFDLHGRRVSDVPIQKMRDLLKHRGPDDEGLFNDGGIALGHVRLSIIDLSEKAHQPMSNESKTVWLVYNGEIYNYEELREELIAKGFKFFSHSDTEVIVRSYEAWGVDAFNKFEGMFAFALWDKSKKEFYLVRDALGIKPLFYFLDNGRIIFASEIKALLASGRIEKKISLKSLSNYLTFFYTPGPETIVEGVMQLEPGRYLKIVDGSIREERYWQLTAKPSPTMDDEELFEAIRSETRYAVKQSLKADVPVGLLLSGGMDSSILLHELVRHCNEKPLAFTIGFSDASYNEANDARFLADVYGIDHHVVTFDVDEVPKIFDDMIYHMDALSANPCLLPEYSYFQLAAKHRKVVLMGSGGDELFAGYPTYVADQLRQRYGVLPKSVRRFIHGATKLLPVSHRKYSFDYFARKFTEGALYESRKSHYWWRTIFTESDKRRLFAQEAVDRVDQLDSFPCFKRFYDEASAWDTNTQHLYTDIYTFLIENALIKVDQLSMASSLEVRPPFLTKRYVEFAMQLPFSVKLKGSQTKHCLRRAYEHELSTTVTQRKKQGILAPIHELFQGGMRSEIEATLRSSTSQQFFNRSEIDTMLARHDANKENNSYKLFTLFCFLRWHHVFMNN